MSLEEVKDEPWSPEDGVSEAALASLYAGHQVKDEMVFGPEVLQPRDRAYTGSAVSEIGHVFRIPATDLSLEVVVVKEEIFSPPSEDPCGLNKGGRRQKPPRTGDQLVVRECFVKLDQTFIDKMPKCKNCLKIFASDVSLLYHTCDSKDSIANISNSALKNKKVNYVCDFCGKDYSCKLTLINHLVIHAGLRQFMCEVCGKQYTHKRNLSRHLLEHKGRKFFCDICCKGYSLKGTLTRHVQAHTGCKFSCKTCSKVFSYKSHLNRHIRLHTNEKRFTCESCARRFTQKHHLIRHRRTHTKEKPFSCESCGRNFAVKHHLTRHVLTHTGRKPCSCQICCSKFAVKSNLVAHIRTHIEKNNFLPENPTSKYTS